MIKQWTEYNNVIWLSLKNAQRWCWRLLTIALLVTFSFTLYLLYGGFVTEAKTGGVARVEPLSTGFFDMLLLLNENQRLLPPEELPVPQYQRHLIDAEDAAVLIPLSGDNGAMQALGLATESIFYSILEQDLRGRLAADINEVALPQSWAEKRGLGIGETIRLSYCGTEEISSWQAEIVGIYDDSESAFPAVLVLLETLLPFTPDQQPNAWMIKLDARETLQHLSEWLDVIYPGATQISVELPQRLGSMMLEQAYSPSDSLVALIFLFMGIGVFTVAQVTFLERRRELAALKALGSTNKQIALLFGFEYGLAGVMGLVFTAASSLLLMGQLSWFSALSGSQLSMMILRGVGITLGVFIVSLIYPMLIAKVATVNQLLYARTIPLAVRDYRYMNEATADLTLREVMQNVRMMRIPYRYDVSSYDCMVFIAKGSSVKQGEVIASQERFQGHMINNFLAPCDGIVQEMSGALVVIKPDDPKAPFFPYPSRPFKDEKELEQVRIRVQEEQRIFDNQRRRQG